MFQWKKKSKFRLVYLVWNISFQRFRQGSPLVAKAKILQPTYGRSAHTGAAKLQQHLIKNCNRDMLHLWVLLWNSNVHRSAQALKNMPCMHQLKQQQKKKNNLFF